MALCSGIGQRLDLMVLESFSNLKDSGILFLGFCSSSGTSWVILWAVSHLNSVNWIPCLSEAAPHPLCHPPCDPFFSPLASCPFF